jgi:hypothetical protein
MDYALGHWTKVQVCRSDGGVEIDNILVENAIRPTAIGKKNWLFIGEADAGAQHDLLTVSKSLGLEPMPLQLHPPTTIKDVRQIYSDVYAYPLANLRQSVPGITLPCFDFR